MLPDTAWHGQSPRPWGAEGSAAHSSHRPLQLVSHANASHSCVCPGQGQSQASCRPRSPDSHGEGHREASVCVSGPRSGSSPRSPDSESRSQPCPVILKGRGAPAPVRRGVALWRPRAEGVTPCGLHIGKILVVAERKTCIPVSDDLSSWGTLCLSFRWDLSDGQGICGDFWWSLSLENQAGPEVAMEGEPPNHPQLWDWPWGAPTPGLCPPHPSWLLRSPGTQALGSLGHSRWQGFPVAAVIGFVKPSPDAGPASVYVTDCAGGDTLGRANRPPPCLRPEEGRNRSERNWGCQGGERWGTSYGRVLVSRGGSLLAHLLRGHGATSSLMVSVGRPCRSSRTSKSTA